MTRQKLINQITDLLDQAGIHQGGYSDATSGIYFIRHHAPKSQEISLYQPLLCLVLQGGKEVRTNTRTLNIANGKSLLVSHTIPVISRITTASPESPYIALVLPLDLNLLRGLVADSEAKSLNAAHNPFSISLCQSDVALEDAIARYLEQVHSPDQRDLLAPITLREIHARLLIGSHGEQLRKLLWHETTVNRIFKATQQIQANLASELAIEKLAQNAGMSKSGFFDHFKSITGISPLQYQKDLRLLQARDHLHNSKDKITKIAFNVGYNSPAQFSREYARKFGISPKQERT